MTSHREPAELVTIYANLDVMLLNMPRDFLRDVEVAALIFDTDASRMLGQGRAAVPARLMIYADAPNKPTKC
jgi:hypothetical protein